MDGLDDLSLVLEITPQVTAALRNLTKGLDQVDESRKKIQSGLGTQINSFLSDIGIRLPPQLAKIVNLLNAFGGSKKTAAGGEETSGGTGSIGGIADMFKGGGKQGFNAGGIDIGKMMGGAEESAGGADMMLAGEAGEAGAGLAGALGPIGMAVGAAVVGLKMFTSAVIGAAQKTVALAAVNNPAVAERFQRSLLDAEGVIGNRLVPVVEMMTKGMRMVGDVLQTILPSERDVAVAMSELDPAINELREACADLAPLMKQTFRDALEVTAFALHEFAETVHVATAFLGLNTGKSLQSSLGMAASQASTVGIEDISKRAIEAAYGQGAGGPQDRTASSAEKILKLLEEQLGRHDAEHQSAGERAESAILGIPAQFMRWIAEMGR